MIQIIAGFISGVLIFNAAPHLLQGICGKKHMTPFSPRSSAWINVVWGWVNIVAGILVARIFQWQAWDTDVWSGFCAGGFFISLSLALFWANPDARLPWHKKDEA